MYRLLLHFCDWLQNTPLALAISGSYWAYPYVQLTHFTGLSLWISTNFAVDLRLLGVGAKRETSAELSQGLFVWNWIGFAIAVTGGFLLFSTAATSFVTNPAFQLKLGLLIPVALVWHIVVQSKSRTWGRTADVPTIAKAAGLIEMVLWFGVATAAVSIPLFEH
jgi:hypothetical protein